MFDVTVKPFLIFKYVTLSLFHPDRPRKEKNQAYLSLLSLFASLFNNMI